MWDKFQEWRGERLKLRAEAIWLLDELLDLLPGQWGCRLRLSRYWDQEKFRKDARNYMSQVQEQRSREGNLREM